MSILQLDPEAAMRSQETFGPAAALIIFDKDDDAVQLTHDPPHGLPAPIWSSEFELAEHHAMKIEAGNVLISAISPAMRVCSLAG